MQMTATLASLPGHHGQTFCDIAKMYDNLHY